MAGRIDRRNGFRNEHIDDRRLEFACDVRLARFGQRRRVAALRFAAHQRQYRRLESRKTEIEIVRCQHRPRQFDRAIASIRCQFRERGSSGICKAQ